MKKKGGGIFKIMRYLCLSSVIVFGLMTIVGTGDDDGSASRGVFVDSPVEGLRYESLFYIGYTNAEGKFKYIPGHTITFSVGGIELGSAVASGTLSPVDLVYGAVDETNDEVTNICIFLQTLDEDGDLNNGIRISEAIRDVIEGSTINFDQTPAEFSADPNVIALLEALNAAGVFTDTVAGDRALRTAEEAQRHMRATLGNRNTINTAYGEVRGFEDECNTWCWRGIPFAKPPLDDLRWKAPMDPDSWEGVREGTEFGNECLQIDSVTGSYIGSEDCLYLNIWRPQSDETNLPVYVRIHGGGNSTGAASSSFPEYYGANLASESNMVYVSVQYRLGPLGWFTHPALRTGNNMDDSGNYGTLDLIKSLEWIQNNIEAFGGDPDNVTIAGESAGAYNVFSLMLSPVATGLFHKAMSESGRAPGTSVEVGEESANSVLLKLLVNDGTAADEAEASTHLAGMSDPEIAVYLRSKPAREIHETYETSLGGTFSFPNIFTDGIVILADGADAFETGTYPNKVPTILGTNKDETKLFLYFSPAYPDKDGELYQTVTKYSSDFWKVDGADGLARKMSSHSDQPDVYVYQFLWGSVRDTGESVVPDPFGSHIGAMHGLEISFFLGNEVGLEDKLAPAGIILKTEQNRPGREALSEAMMAYVAQFVRTGNPNQPGSGLPEWTHWSNNEDESKCILFDADYDAIDIEMSMTEVTEEGLLAEIDMLPEELAEAVLNYLGR